MHEGSIYDRLKELIAYSGLSQNKFAKKTSIDSGLMSNMLSGSRFGIDKLIQILNAFPEISSEWLLRGEGSMQREPATLPKASDPKVVEKLLNYVQHLEDENDAYKKGVQALEKTCIEQGVDLTEVVLPVPVRRILQSKQ